MKSYELTYIISSSLTTDEVHNVIKDTESFIQGNEGVILSSEKTSAQPLAYPIRKQSSGYFATIIFQAEAEKVKALKDKLDKEKEVLRSIVLIKKPVKELKARRMRKPLTQASKELGEILTDKDVKKGEKVKPEDIDKQLDQILGE